MNLLSIVQNFGLPQDEVSEALYRTFVNGLNAQEACSLLDVDFGQGKYWRQLFTRKIAADMKAQILPCHEVLLIEIESRFPAYSYLQCQRAGDCLGALYDVAHTALKEQIERLFLGARYKGLRKYVYQKLYDNWSTVHEIHQSKALRVSTGAHIANWRASLAPSIEALWNEHHEEEWAEIIIAHFPDTFLIEHFSELQQIVWWKPRRRLYERIFPLDESKISLAVNYDSITAVWVLAQMGGTLDNADAFTLFLRARHNEKIGLLIRCYGQMGLWEVLLRIYHQVTAEQAEDSGSST